MGVYIPNMKMPDCCFNCHYDDCPHWVSNSFEKPTDCPLIEIGDTVWENEKYKLIRMTQEARFNKAMAERRAE